MLSRHVEQKDVPGSLFKAVQTLPRYRRIGRKEGFNLESGNSITSDNWFVLYARSSNLECSRLGIIVSKRIEPKASSRNFAKRLIRETFRRKVPQQCAIDIVVRVRRKFGRQFAQDISESLTRLMSGIQLKCAE